MGIQIKNLSSENNGGTYITQQGLKCFRIIRTDQYIDPLMNLSILQFPISVNT